MICLRVCGNGLRGWMSSAHYISFIAKRCFPSYKYISALSTCAYRLFYAYLMLRCTSISRFALRARMRYRQLRLQQRLLKACECSPWLNCNDDRLK